MKKEKGITMITLVITIMVLSILVSIATYSGITAIEMARFNAFKAELKIMQTEVNAIYEKGNEEDNNKYGKDIIGDIRIQAEKVFQLDMSGITDHEGYKYWDKEQIKNLGIEGVEHTFFVNITKRSIVSYEGVKYKEKIYHTLEQLPEELYNVEYTKPLENAKPTFNVDYEYIGSGKSKITISNIQYLAGYIDKWQVKYKLQEKENWNTSEDLSFVVNEQGNYEVFIFNQNIESEVKNLKETDKYEKEGLLLHYDGIENTRDGNNPQATSWEDLSKNQNDGIFYNMNMDSGYYNSEENGYVFLHNDSYIQSKNKIGISGDANFTIEVVSKLWEEGKNPNYSTFTFVNPAWWGSANPTVGATCAIGYERNRKKIYSEFINNMYETDETYDLIGKTSYLSFRKTKNGEIKNGDTDIGKIKYNQNILPSTYLGTATFICNLEDSQVQVGRSWQWANQNRTFYGSIQAVRIYNRVLTDEEIENNYKIDKIRFHIE